MRWILARSLLASCVMLFSVASYGQTPINSVPYVISAPGTYVVMQDLSYGLPTGNAITISSSNVTLDFDSHTLVCAITPKDAVGVLVSSGENVKIQNGTVSGFTIGISLKGNVEDAVVQEMRLTQNKQIGIDIFVTASGCLCKDNYITTSRNGIICNGPYTQLSRNRVLDCFEHGIAIGAGLSVGARTYVDSNLVCKCGTGISSSPFTKLRFNTTLDCTIPFTHGTDVGASSN